MSTLAGYGVHVLNRAPVVVFAGVWIVFLGFQFYTDLTSGLSNLVRQLKWETGLVASFRQISFVDGGPFYSEA